MGTLLPAEDAQAWAAFDVVPAAIVVVDPATRIVFTNGGAEELFGRGRSALIGTFPDAWLEEPSQQWWTEQAARLLRTDGKSIADEVVVVRREDGRGLPVKVSLHSEVTMGGRRIVAVFSDLTELRLSAQLQIATVTRARENRVRLETLLEFAPAIILAVSPDGVIDYVNKVLPTYSKDDVIGSSWLNYFPPDLHARMTSALQKVLAHGSSETFETSTTSIEGTAVVWFGSHLGPIREDGQIVGAVVVAQDITKRKRAETELIAAQRMAVLGTLAAGVAHEINTPIQFVGDSIRFLSDSAADLLALIDRFGVLRRMVTEGRPISDAISDAIAAEEEADLRYIRERMPSAFERCIEGLNRVTTIVRSLRDFAHPANQKMAAVDFNHAVESTLIIASNEYKYVADLETDFGELPHVQCNVGEINQAVLNIVVNAAHAIGNVVQGTESRGVIRVRTFRDADMAVVTISDTGGGIPEAIRARIFDPFFTTKEVGKGTGQGLAIAWAVIQEKHGGELTFETTVGVGTTFIIRLPILGRPATEDAA